MDGMPLNVSVARGRPQMPAEKEGSSWGEHLCLSGLGELLSGGDAPVQGPLTLRCVPSAGVVLSQKQVHASGRTFIFVSSQTKIRWFS